METGSASPEPDEAARARVALRTGLSCLAANDTHGALRWLDRAHRLLPADPSIALSLATACLEPNPARAESLFDRITADHDIAQGWLGLAVARLRLNRPDAADPLRRLLSTHAFLPESTAIATQVTALRPTPIAAAPAAAGPVGWCALHSDGTVEAHAPGRARLTIRLDGKPIRGRRLPSGWRLATELRVCVDDTDLFGSPIDIRAICRLVGCVELTEDGITGWAWYPRDPASDPQLTVSTPSGPSRPFRAIDAATIPDLGPLARPRAFHLTRAELAGMAGLVHVRGPDGRDLLGSPLRPFAEADSLGAAATSLSRAYPATPRAVRQTLSRPDGRVGRTTADLPAGPPVWPILRADAPVPPAPSGANPRVRPVTVVVPLHGGGAVVQDCLASLLKTIPQETRVILVDDGSPDPDFAATLDELVRRPRIALIRHPVALGFPAAANAGIRAAGNRDVVLLNSDTLLPPDWLPRLRGAAYAATDVGTVTPFSNQGSLLSYPHPGGANPTPDQRHTDHLDRLARRANGDAIVDIPVGVGFCLYLRRDCLDAVGLFRDDIFAQGYGEENDFCLRARRLGWRNVAHTGLFVGHVAGSSFGAAANHLRRRNSTLIERLHPGHDALIAAFLRQDPLAAARRRIDLAAWRQHGRSWRQSVILIAHDQGGGVERRLAGAIRAHAEAGRRPIILRPAETPDGTAAIAVSDGSGPVFPNLVFTMPSEQAALLRLLKAARPHAIEAHHLADYSSEIYDLIAAVGVPYEAHVHDYAWFCPRVSLVGPSNRYCGEPDLPQCEACAIDYGSFLKEVIDVESLRRRSATFLAGARRVVAPSDDAAARMRRHFPGLRPQVVPHDDDSAIGTAKPALLRGNRQRVCVVGAIGIQKGFDILLACARDAKNRSLDLEFVVVGYTIDDARIMDTGRVFVTGEYKPHEAVDLIAAQHAQLGFVPSVTPETWCLSLGELWRAGLPVAAFDIGAPAERIRRTGRGIVLPLNLSPSAMNTTLIAAMRTAVRA